MSNDTGITVRHKNGKWTVNSICMSNDVEHKISEHDTRTEALEKAAIEAEWPTEYGIVHVDPEEPHNEK